MTIFTLANATYWDDPCGVSAALSDCAVPVPPTVSSGWCLSLRRAQQAILGQDTEGVSEEWTWRVLAAPQSTQQDLPPLCSPRRQWSEGAQYSQDWRWLGVAKDTLGARVWGWFLMGTRWPKCIQWQFQWVWGWVREGNFSWDFWQIGKQPKNPLSCPTSCTCVSKRILKLSY